MTDQEIYLHGSTYSLFLEKAFEFDLRLDRPSPTEISNLIDAENGIKHYKHKTAEKQAEEIKIRLKKGIELLLNQKKYRVDKVELKEQLTEIDFCYSSDSIIMVINKCIDYLHVDD